MYRLELKLKKKLVILLILLVAGLNLNATHNRSGSITYRHISGNTYEFTVKTCTESASDADRPSLEVKWGDGTLDTIPRVDIIENQTYLVQENFYIGIHTYTGPGSFIISVEDPNRNAGVINISNSVNQVFCIQTELIISPFLGPGNNSVVIENCPCPEFACLNETYCYNLSVFDPDEDSLSYEIVPCRGENCLEMNIPNVFRFPDTPINQGGGGGSMSIDPISGTLCWIGPGLLGEYNVAIKVSEYRNGIYIGSVVQDMQLTVKDCINESPEIVEKPDTCIFAGDNAFLTFTATDSEDSIYLFATGSIFNLNSNPAFFNDVLGGQTVTSFFSWTPNCDQASQTSYTFIVHAEDQNTDVQLSDLLTYQIKVNIPPVQNVDVHPLGGSVSISWSPLGLNCPDITYNVYRYTDSLLFENECCDQGLASSLGYQFIGSTADTFFLDSDNLSVGVEYCYMITALNNSGIEGCLSTQACTSLMFEVPVMTNVSVFETNSSTGKDSIYWSWPKELNMVNFPGPYYYELFRSDGLIENNPILIHTSNTNPDISLVDTFYYDIDLNTFDQPHAYSVHLFSDGSLVGEATSASSIYLNSTPNDNQLELFWNVQVPWINDYYRIYKETPTGSGNFVLIDSTATQFYIDTNLVNLSTYCYKVESVGYYGEKGIRDPILNWSQEHCNEPYDFTPPCPPAANITGDCETEETLIYWTNPNLTCADDVVAYNLYFAPFEGDSLIFLTNVNSALDTFYVHKDRGSIAGCYYVTAVDSFPYQNESIPSNMVCIDNCDGYYELPNVFTPNGNNINDLFHPKLPYKFVESIEINIFNRYGELVFTTTDPMINWDGTHLISGKKVVDGTYFYVCTANIIKLAGIQPFTFQGSISVFNSKLK